jgi:hypothetical protein
MACYITLSRLRRVNTRVIVDFTQIEHISAAQASFSDLNTVAANQHDMSGLMRVWMMINLCVIAVKNTRGGLLVSMAGGGTLLQQFAGAFVEF